MRQHTYLPVNKSLKKIVLLPLTLLCLHWATAQGIDQQQITPEEAARILQQQQQQEQQQGLRINNNSSPIENPPQPARPGTTDQNRLQQNPAAPVRQRIEAPEENEFQNFVSQSVGQKLPIFGQS